MRGNITRAHNAHAEKWSEKHYINSKKKKAII